MLFFAMLVPPASAQKDYIDEVLKIIEANSIRRDSVDFKMLRQEAYQMLENAKTVQDCYPIVRYMLKQLNDHHSFLMEKEAVDRWLNTSKSPDAKKQPPPYSGKVLFGKIGYIQMLGFGSGDPVAIQTYAAELQNLIRSLDGNYIAGWILDLRENGGGNCWPMLVGAGPLLGNGVCGFFIDGRGDKAGWYYKNGEAGIKSALCKLKGTPYKLVNATNPVAVLTGPRTASSGEVMVTSFKGRPNAKSFGEATAGLSTGNDQFKLSDGSMILLTTSVYADRTGRKYGGKIKPDVYEPFDKVETQPENDRVVKRAFDWITKGN